MAYTPAELQRRYRARLKEKLKAAPEQTASVITRSFSDFLNSDDETRQSLSFIGETLDSVGLDLPDLTTDEDPEWREEWGFENRGSLGRAERMVAAWIDSAKELAGLINRFKLEEIEAAITALERSKKLDAGSLSEAVRLNKLRDRLRKEVRHGFSATVVKGD